MAFEIKLDNFSGPFDLLLHLIDEEKVDIYTVSISKLTDDYLRVVEQMRENKLDIGSEFLLMATTLLELKSRMLLPGEAGQVTELEDEADRLSLLDRLVEYKRFKTMAEQLEARRDVFQDVFYRYEAIRRYIQENHITPQWTIAGADLGKLLKAFEELWKRRFLDETEEHQLRQDTITVRDKIAFILDLLSTRSSLSFFELFSESPTRLEVIVSFLAILEIVKRQLVGVAQDALYGEIRIMRNWGEMTPLPVDANEKNEWDTPAEEEHFASGGAG